MSLLSVCCPQSSKRYFERCTTFDLVKSVLILKLFERSEFIDFLSVQHLDIFFVAP